MELILLAVAMLLILSACDAHLWPAHKPAPRRMPRRVTPRRSPSRAPAPRAGVAYSLQGAGRAHSGGPWWWE